MSRIERRIAKVSAELEAMAREEELLRGELSFHRSLHEDASRDAAVYDTPIERENAYETRKDVTNFERALADLEARRARLLEKRDALLDRMGR